MTLARFRADPSKVRVSIRKMGTLWVACVRHREQGIWLTRSSTRPRYAVIEAIKAADGFIDGIDLDTQWTYEHPWKEGEE